MKFFKKLVIALFVFCFLLLPKIEGSYLLSAGKKVVGNGASTKHKKHPDPTERESDSQTGENEDQDQFTHKDLTGIPSFFPCYFNKLQKGHCYFMQQPLLSKYPDITTPPPEKA
jgi:hypothetical protein